MMRTAAPLQGDDCSGPFEAAPITEWRGLALPAGGWGWCLQRPHDLALLWRKLSSHLTVHQTNLEANQYVVKRNAHNTLQRAGACATGAALFMRGKGGGAAVVHHHMLLYYGP